MVHINSRYQGDVSTGRALWAPFTEAKVCSPQFCPMLVWPIQFLQLVSE